MLFAQLVRVTSCGLGNVELEEIAIAYTSNSKDNFITHYQVTV